MAYNHLLHFIDTLEQNNELVRIKEFVNPELEITEITDRISKVYGPALLFENNGTEFPLLINSMGNDKRICLALGVNDLSEISNEIEDLFKDMTGPKVTLLDKLKLLPKLGKVASWMPKTISGKGACQQVVMTDPDITKFPVLKCWPEDGGRFITFPLVHTKDPNTGIRNVGMYRMQVFEPKLTGMHYHRHKTAARHCAEYKKLCQKMPIAVVLGGDPAYTYSATAPLPDGVDEYILAGFLRKKSVELVKCLTVDLEVPADADIVIEGYVDPEEDLIWEGPFGDHTGYYSLADWYPKFHITCITHRKNAVYPTTIVGIPPQEDVFLGKATERIFSAPIKMTVMPEFVDMVLPMEGVFHNIVIAKIKKTYPGQAIKAMNALWGAGQMMFTKFMIIVDECVDIHNFYEVAKYISLNVNPDTDIYISQGPMDVLDHAASKTGFGGKMGIDATKKLPEEIQTKTIHKDVNSKINKELIYSEYPEIKDINDSLLNLGISTVFISIQKNRKNNVEELTNSLFKREEFKAIKAIIFLEHTMDISDIADVIWRSSNNTDANRDVFVIKTKNDDEFAHIGFDGTRKNKEFDNFDKDWPNILASTPETIQHIDKIWDKLGLGKFIKSPSIKYLPQVYKGGAMVKE